MPTTIPTDSEIYKAAEKLLGAAGTLDGNWSLSSIRRVDPVSVDVLVMPRKGGQGLRFRWSEPADPTNTDAFIKGSVHCVSIIGGQGCRPWDKDTPPAVKRRAIKACRTLSALRQSIGISE